MLFIAAICALCLSTFGEAAHIKVGIYNAIPDLNGDGLQSYKVMIQDEYKKLTGNTVDAAVSRTEYDPYSNNLRGYLNTFDILEIDTTTLGKTHNALHSKFHKARYEATVQHGSAHRIMKCAVWSTSTACSL